jgi:hypothetical protein
MSDTVEFVNLSRGLSCSVEQPRYMRIQSTWCEQKRWADVLWTLPADAYYHLAQGYRCIVHDQSEKPRQTRAQWQGLSLVRFVCGVAWYETAPAEHSRSGMHISPYWAEQYNGLPERLLTYVARFKEWAVGGPVRLESCTCWITADQPEAA